MFSHSLRKRFFSLLFSLIIPVNAGTNLIANSNFSTELNYNDNVFYDHQMPGAIWDGWGILDWAGFSSSNYSLVYKPLEGIGHLQLAGYLGFSTDSLKGDLYQTVNTIPGKSYSLKYWMCSDSSDAPTYRKKQNASIKFKIYDSQYLGQRNFGMVNWDRSDTTILKNNWEPKAFVFKANQPQTTIRFYTNDQFGNQGIFVGAKVNRVTLEQVPNNTDWFSAAKYGLFFHYIPGENNIPKVVEIRDTTKKHNSWDSIVNSFNVNAFAKQMCQLNVGYVIFTIGQTSGYYVSPNTAYLNYTHTKLGDYCSTRDLISEIADALNANGIKLIVYLAAQGPTDTDKDSNTIDNIFLLEGEDGNALNPHFRSRYNTMIAEWSYRWGKKVSGWWFDGCWVDGYSKTTATNKDPQNNLNDLIAAAKAGNADAIVATNYGVDEWCPPPSYMADFTAGEIRELALPLPNPTTLMGTRFQNVYNWSYLQIHYLSYLGPDAIDPITQQKVPGSGWAKPGLKYTNETVLNFIKSANANDRVVTLDAAIFKDGKLDPQQVGQLAFIRNQIKAQ